MKKIALTIFALGAALASPVLASEATHNNLPVAQPSIETIRSVVPSAGFDASIQSAFMNRTAGNAAVDAARGAQSGN